MILVGFLSSMPFFCDFFGVSHVKVFFKIMIGVLISFFRDVDRLSYLKAICFWHLSSKTNMREFRRNTLFQMYLPCLPHVNKRCVYAFQPFPDKMRVGNYSS